MDNERIINLEELMKKNKFDKEEIYLVKKALCYYYQMYQHILGEIEVLKQYIKLGINIDDNKKMLEYCEFLERILKEK